MLLGSGTCQRVNASTIPNQAALSVSAQMAKEHSNTSFLFGQAEACTNKRFVSGAPVTRGDEVEVRLLGGTIQAASLLNKSEDEDRRVSEEQR